MPGSAARRGAVRPRRAPRRRPHRRRQPWHARRATIPRQRAQHRVAPRALQRAHRRHAARLSSAPLDRSPCDGDTVGRRAVALEPGRWCGSSTSSATRCARSSSSRSASAGSWCSRCRGSAASTSPRTSTAAYQISTGSSCPEEIEDSEFSGACLPTELTDQVRGVPGRVLPAPAVVARSPTSSPEIDRRDAGRWCSRTSLRCAATDDAAVTFSTFGSPVPYLPQTIAVLASRARWALDAGGDAARRPASRCWRCTCRRSRSRSAARPAPKWAICAVALIPVAVFQSRRRVARRDHHRGVAPGGVVGTACARPATERPPTAARRRSGAAQRAARDVQAGLRGARRPLPAAAPRSTPARADLWPLALAPDRRCSSRRWRGTRSSATSGAPTPTTSASSPIVAAQRDELLTAPWHFVADAAARSWDETWDWLEGLASVGTRVTHWPVVVVGDRDRDLRGWCRCSTTAASRRSLHWSQRGLVVVVFLRGVALVLGASYVYWNDAGRRQIGGVQARYFVPLLVLVAGGRRFGRRPVAPRARGARSRSPCSSCRSWRCSPPPSPSGCTDAPSIPRRRGVRSLRSAPVTAPRVSVVIPVYNEGEAIVPCLDRILQAVRLPVRGARGLRRAGRLDAAVPREVPAHRSPGRARAQRPRSRPGAGDPMGDRAGATRRSRSSRWPTAATIPSRSTTLPISSTAAS